MSEHTESFKKFRANYERRKICYEALWGTNYCKSCRGWGYTSYRYDPSPNGVSLGSGYTEDTDPCGSCVEKGICPRCGKESLDEDGNICSQCGWECMTADSQGLDEEPECECWLSDAF